MGKPYASNTSYLCPVCGGGTWHRPMDIQPKQVWPGILDVYLHKVSLNAFFIIWCATNNCVQVVGRTPEEVQRRWRAIENAGKGSISKVSDN